MTDVGETSYTLEYELRNGDAAAATVTTVAVAVDADGPTSIPDSLREGLEADLAEPT
nr:hypothetical protein [Natrinema sp. DC36]